MRRPEKVLALVLPFIVMAAVLAPSASANHLAPGPASTTRNVQPTQEDGNTTCADELGAGDFLFEYKLEPVQDTVAPIPIMHGGLVGTLSVDEHDPGGNETFDFSVSGDFVLAAVLAKGGDN